MLTVCRGKLDTNAKMTTYHNEIVYDEDLDENCPLCEAILAIRKLGSEIEDVKQQAWKEGYERGVQVTENKVMEKLGTMKEEDIRPIQEVIGG